MSNILADSPFTAAVWLILKCSTLLGIAVLVQSLIARRASASTRHLVWTFALATATVLPLASVALPRWQVAIQSASAPVLANPIPVDRTESVVSENPSTSTAGAVVDLGEPPRAPAISTTAMVAFLYLSGIVGLLAYWTAERWSLRRFARRAKPFEDPEWVRLLDDCSHAIGIERPVRLLRSVERNVPMTFGVRQPAIVLPAIAETWDGNRRRAVVLHELAHVARQDCLTHLATLVACAMYWFHPGVWWVARRVRLERELACDDRVIAAGTEPREYAGHLLEIAYSFGGRRAPALAVCMARPRQLEGRMLAALNAATNRRMPSHRTVVLLATAALAVLVPLSALTLRLHAAPPVPAEWPAATESPTPSVSQPPSSQTKDWNDLKTVQNLKPLWDLTRFQGLAPAWHRPGITRALRAVASAAGIAQENQPGTWEIRPTDKSGVVHLRIVELNSSSGSDVPVQQLEGLTGAQLTGAGGPVQFKVRRDAGTFTFEGVIRSGVGAGTFTFTPDPNFPAELAKRGFARPTPSEQYQLARNDVGYAFLDELTKQGYAKPQTADLVRAGQHGVQTTYLREMGELGYKLGTLDPLITLRDHGVTPTYVRDLADLGYKGLSADEVRQARDHGITAEYVRGMRDAGYGSLPMRELINARDHGITTQYVRELDAQGYRKLPLDQLIGVRDHGVTPEYARGMRELGYTLLVDDLVRARDHGVTLEYLREMAALGYGKQPIDALIRVRDHGVTSEFAKDVKGLGYDNLPLEDLVTLRDHGWSAERIRNANAKAGTRLPVDMLKSLR